MDRISKIVISDNFTGCNRVTYVMDHFVQHMKNSPTHTDSFKCQFCGFKTLIAETAKHLLVHSIGVYECVYCHYGSNDIESIQSHMCNTHPSKLLYICVRLTRKDRTLVSKTFFIEIQCVRSPYVHDMP